MGEISNDISSESTHHIYSPKSMHTPKERVYQCCSKNCEISNFGIFPFSLYHRGVKVSQGASSLKEHTGLLFKFSV